MYMYVCVVTYIHLGQLIEVPKYRNLGLLRKNDRVVLSRVIIPTGIIFYAK